MIASADIPIPIRFNAFKHHRNYLMEFLRNAPSEVVIAELDPLCNNYIDVYFGEMSAWEIGQAIANHLKSIGALKEKDFNCWIQSKKGYREIMLGDQSRWIVRQSVETERYVHIHPARTGPLVVRFKGSSLKTAYILKIKPRPKQSLPTLEEVNAVREQIGLSPVKKLETGKGILKCCDYFP